MQITAGFFDSLRSLCVRSAYRTYACASAAVYAKVSVDDHLVLSFADSVYGTAGNASATVNAIIINYVSHIFVLLKNIKFKRYFYNIS